MNFYLSALAGFLGGVQGSFIWGFTLASKQDNGMYHISTYSYMAIGFFFGFMQLRNMNNGLRLFKEVDVIPVYETMMILMNLTCGSIILSGESVYTWMEFFRLLGCAGISMIGVYILIKKPGCVKECGES